jgi:hypothetical protein
MWTNSREKPSLKKKPVIDRGPLVWDEGDELAEIPALLVDHHPIPSSRKCSSRHFIRSMPAKTSSFIAGWGKAFISFPSINIPGDECWVLGAFGR